MSKKKSLLTWMIMLIAIPGVVAVGGVVFRERYYAWVALCVALLSCVPLFYSFERKASSAKELTVLAVLIALSVAGRFIFAWLPGFKPVTAMTVIAAVYLGKEGGFAVGSLSAVVSNFYFGQGPWTPFQMLAWGLIGFVAGALAQPMKKNKILLCTFGFLAGVFYSLTMDVWTTLWAEGVWNWSRYIASMVAALPITAEYAVSNVIFLLLLARPMGQKLERIKTKYGLFLKNN